MVEFVQKKVPECYIVQTKCKIMLELVERVFDELKWYYVFRKNAIFPTQFEYNVQIIRHSICSYLLLLFFAFKST